ncbi:hydantoinase B/oxoprolinase family protein [Streptomyces rhizosphaericus]|uniref:Hydantoinase B/oxoprolinase family protein n=2 Tax=Streptomyces TaxID=1883 RepID=A0A6G4AJG0_9ACTN|nr:hydantoinase B/oxoprolinase family protein [Streptomyces rhizosphaericus]NEW72637.1 hydantoinase B/oxoprolinase family protein [Streptomyces rhizosphaericus]
MTIQIAGSEKFANRSLPAAELRDRIEQAGHVRLTSHVRRGEVDALTYEVVRYRLATLTHEAGEAIKRMSGSVIVTDCNDFDFSIMNELGEQVQVGLFNTQLVATMDMAVQWTLLNRAANPGIGRGDMFLCNDPWIGGGLHQNDVSVFAPFFVGDELFGWTCAVAHQADLGGIAPGSRSVHARDVFAESLPTPPVKIVEAGRSRADIEDVYLRRSRVPDLVALDLRAKVGANKIAQEGLDRLVERYGADVVKDVMRRMIDDAEARLRAKLRQIPDGSVSSATFQDSAREGDDGVYKIALTLTKRDDHLTFDFTGTDPQVEGFINCTHAGLRGGIMPALLTLLCGDIPWAAGGFVRCIDVISEPGSVNDATFPASVGKASVGSAWATHNVVSECVATLIDSSAPLRPQVMSVCMGTWDSAVLSGVDQRGHRYVTSIGDPMAGGMGARTESDGVDTGGLAFMPMGRIADAEMNEFNFPVLYLWRREEPDSGGPGRQRGGVGGSSCFVLHDAPDRGASLLTTGGGKAVPQAVGLAGGLPASTQHDVLVRGSDVRQVLAGGALPASLDDLHGERELMPAHLATSLAWDDVYYMHWTGGGGYGDPLARDPHAVAADVAAGLVTPHAARDVYGTVLDSGSGDDGGGVDVDRTARRRETLRRARAGQPDTTEQGAVAHEDR